MIEMTVAWAVTTASVLVGILIVTIGALATYLFVRFMIWWWDQP
jgi:hypothetical protein